jgi:hypothetical protein
MNYHEALERAIKGESISAKRMSEGCLCYLRHMAWSIGCVLQDSGIGDYRTYRFVKPVNFEL